MTDPTQFPPPPYPAAYPQPQQQAQPAQPGAWTSPNMGPPPPQAQGVVYQPIDEQEAEEAFKQSTADGQQAGFGPKIRYVKVLGPQSEEKWGSTVPQGYKGQLRLFLILPFARELSHFWKSAQFPGGRTVQHPEGDCDVCIAKGPCFDSSDPRLVNLAKTFGRVRKTYYYNAFIIDYPQMHIYPDGTWRPLVLAAGPQLQKAITAEKEHLGSSGALFDIDHGRPIMIQKEKDGPLDMDITWTARALDAQPLPEQFRAMLNNLWDVAKIPRVSTTEQVRAAAIDMGFPMGHVQPPMMGAPYAMAQPPIYQVPGAYPQGPPQMYPQPMAQPMPYQPPQQAPMPYQPPPTEAQWQPPAPPQQQMPAQPTPRPWTPPGGPPPQAQPSPYAPVQPSGYVQGTPPPLPGSNAQAGPAPGPSAAYQPPPALPSAGTPPPPSYQPQPGQAAPATIGMNAGGAPVPPPPPPVPATNPAGPDGLTQLQEQLKGK